MGQRRDAGVTLIFQIIYMTDEKNYTHTYLQNYNRCCHPKCGIFGPDMNHLNLTLCVNYS